jgi:uncharacterized 2Fe-2S/4Fe-4S cluster protein (DUF4445 family)
MLMIIMPVVFIEPYGIRVVAKKGQTLLEVLRTASIPIQSLCGGYGACGKDKIIVVRGKEALSPLTSSEKKYLSPEEIAKGYRLSCQARIIDENVVGIFIPEESRVKKTERKVASEGYMKEYELDPLVKKITVIVPQPALDDQRGDFERIRDTVVKITGLKEIRASLEILQELPFKARNNGWKFSAIFWGDELIEIKNAEDTGGIFGVGVDIGTSKIVVHLVDLEKGEIKKVAFAENPQLGFGEDIMTRMTFANANKENLLKLHNLLIEVINDLIGQVTRESGVSPENIYEVVVVGNTAMHHFFLGLPTNFLASSPYVPVIADIVSFNAKDLGLKTNSRAKVTVLPNIAGYVGADAVADAVAVNILEKKDNILLVDIGTNTEIFAGNAEAMVTCSTPSGPALEGAHIIDGMKAVEGAIERVSIDENGNVEYETIGNAKPKGICGSGIIDAIAQLFIRGIIDARGKIVKNLPLNRIVKGTYGWGYVLAWGNETSSGKDIIIWERDISEILLAKAAIYTGISIAIRRRGIGIHDLKEIYIAGSFGYHIDPVNAIIIGLFPDLPVDKIHFVGNTAIAGADLALLSKKAREEAKNIVQRAKYIELTIDPLFQKEFVSALSLPHRELERFPSVAKILQQKR